MFLEILQIGALLKTQLSENWNISENRTFRLPRLFIIWLLLHCRMPARVPTTKENNVRWLDINRRVLISTLMTHSGGRFSNLTNDKSAWRKVIEEFNRKSGLAYDKKVLVTQCNSMKKNLAVFEMGSVRILPELSLGRQVRWMPTSTRTLKLFSSRMHFSHSTMIYRRFSEVTTYRFETLNQFVTRQQCYERSNQLINPFGKKLNWYVG